MAENLKRVLWTGGWDSTYRIVELSFQEVKIEPIYVIDPGRHSTKLELEAMEKIILQVKEKKQTKAIFLPIKKINLSEIPENEEITTAYQTFSSKTGLGSQHDWLARLATLYPGLELCIEKAIGGGHTPVRDAIKSDGALIKTEDGFIIDKEKSTKELQLIFGNFVLPIFDKTEIDMLNQIKEWKYEDVMSNIWFCHRPLAGNKPCGVCNPCCTKADYHMNFLLPDKALLRNKRLKLIKKVLGEKAAFFYKRCIWHFGR